MLRSGLVKTIAGVSLVGLLVLLGTLVFQRSNNAKASTAPTCSKQASGYCDCYIARIRDDPKKAGHWAFAADTATCAMEIKLVQPAPAPAAK